MKRKLIRPTTSIADPKYLIGIHPVVPNVKYGDGRTDRASLLCVHFMHFVSRICKNLLW
jgi:hypothetical protein